MLRVRQFYWTTIIFSDVQSKQAVLLNFSIMLVMSSFIGLPYSATSDVKS